jgi:hypothetical protein
MDGEITAYGIIFMLGLKKGAQRENGIFSAPPAVFGCPERPPNKH